MSYKITNLLKLNNGLTVLLLDKKVPLGEHMKHNILINGVNRATFNLQHDEYTITVNNFSDLKNGMTIELV